MALRTSWASWAFQMTVVVRIIRAPRWAGPCGQLGGVVAVAAVPATARAVKRLASGSVPSRAGITACGGGPFHPRRDRPQARPSAGAPRRMRARRTAMMPIMSPSPQLRRRHVLAAEMPIYQVRFVNRFR
jgi:hypothetical protein